MMSVCVLLYCRSVESGFANRFSLATHNTLILPPDSDCVCLRLAILSFRGQRLRKQILVGNARRLDHTSLQPLCLSASCYIVVPWTATSQTDSRWQRTMP